MTKDESFKEATEFVKSRSTRHALERVLKAVQLHLPPDGISERDAMGMIIEAVDPMPDDFDSEKCIKEVMDLFDIAIQTAVLSEYAKSQNSTEWADIMSGLFDSERKAIEAKLRQLIQ